jgi:hypothetical protein
MNSGGGRRVATLLDYSDDGDDEPQSYFAVSRDSEGISSGNISSLS